MTRIKILAVPGPSGDARTSGMGYLTSSLCTLMARNRRHSYEIYVAGFPSHQLDHTSRATPCEMNVRIYEPEELGLKSTNGSAEHAALLNALIRDTTDVKSDYTLILDPDFFLLREDFLGVLEAEVSRHKLGLIGASYPEWRIYEYWDFPTAFFMFGPSNQRMWNAFDFSPGWVESSAFREWVARYRVQLDYRIASAIDRVLASVRARRLGVRPTSYRGLLYWFLHPHPLKISPRTYCGDTGRRIRDAFHNSIPTEVFSVAVRDRNSPSGMPGFRVEEYLRVNPDLGGNLEFGSWHASNVGIVTGRSIGRQRLSWHLARLVGKERRADSGLLPTRHLVLDPDCVFPERGDLYLWDGVPCGLHLSSRGKRGLPEDLEMIEAYLRELDLLN